MPSEQNSEVKANVAALIGKARAAQLIYQRYDQEQVDEVVTAAPI